MPRLSEERLLHYSDSVRKHGVPVSRATAADLLDTIDVLTAERDQARQERDTLCAKFSDLAVEMEKHSNDHLHAFLSSDRQSAAVEGVCADRIKSIIAELQQYSERPLSSPPAYKTRERLA